MLNHNQCISAAFFFLNGHDSYTKSRGDKGEMKVFFFSIFLLKGEHWAALCYCSVNTDNQTLFFFFVCFFTLKRGNLFLQDQILLCSAKNLHNVQISGVSLSVKVKCKKSKQTSYVSINVAFVSRYYCRFRKIKGYDSSIFPVPDTFSLSVLWCPYSFTNTFAVHWGTAHNVVFKHCACQLPYICKAMCLMFCI